MAECPEGASGTVTVTEEVTESPTVCKTFDFSSKQSQFLGQVIASGREISCLF